MPTPGLSLRRLRALLRLEERKRLRLVKQGLREIGLSVVLRCPEHEVRDIGFGMLREVSFRLFSRANVALLFDELTENELFRFGILALDENG